MYIFVYYTECSAGALFGDQHWCWQRKLLQALFTVRKTSTVLYVCQIRDGFGLIVSFSVVRMHQAFLVSCKNVYIDPQVYYIYIRIYYIYYAYNI
jgi:hypothetical protein